MRQRTRLIVNSLVNVTARVVTIATRFLIVPFAIGVMGDAYYGLWIIVGQMFAYTRLFEMGLRSAVTREVALRIARDEHEILNRYLNTATAYFIAVGAVIAMLTVVVSVFFVDWFHVESAYQTSARVMVLCAGFALALTVAQYAFSAVLAGLQRFDIISGVDIGADVLRLVLILAMLKQFSTGGGMMLLAIVSGGTALAAAILRTIASLRLYPQATIRPWRADRKLLWPMACFGINTVIYMMSAMVAVQLAQIVIGAMMSTARATHFRLAVEIVTAVHVAVVACAVGIKVAGSKYDGLGDSKMLRHLLIQSTRYTAIVSLMGVVGVFVFSDAFLRLWQRGNYAGAEGEVIIGQIAATCKILAIGFGLFWLMLPAFNVVNGMGRHRFTAIVAAVAALAAMIAVTICASREAAMIEWVAWGVVLPMIPVWSVVVPWYCCREVGEPIRRYVWAGLLVPMIGCTPALLVGMVAISMYPATTWDVFMVEVMCTLVALIPSVWFFVMARDDRAHLRDAMVALYRRYRHA